MTGSPGLSPLLLAIAEASGLVRELIAVLKRESESLAGAGAPADLFEVKTGLVAAHARALDRLREASGTPELTLDELRALDELKALDAELMAATLDSLIAANPEMIDLRYRRARTLVGQGRDEAAHQDYLAVLSREPTHLGALNDFGNLLFDAGYRSAARTLYLQAVTAHPDLPAGYVNLANLLLSQADYEEAKSHYQTALRLEPALAEAHRGMAYALSELGDEAGASAHREPGFRGHAVMTWPHRGPGRPLPLLILSSAMGGNIPLKHILDERTFLSSVVLSEYFDQATPLPPHQLVINIIGDADLCQSGLAAAEGLLTRSFGPVINPPALVRPTGRLENVRRLGVLPGVITPRSALLPRSALMGRAAEGVLAEHGIGFPLLLRSPGFHTGHHFMRVEMPADLAQAAAALPGQDLLVMQVLDARNRQGDSHKYRVMFVNGALYPLHLAISNHWKVHYFSSGMDGQPEYRAQEAAFLDDMPSVLGVKAIAALDSVRRVLGLDYGGIDFALGPDGDILLFEANATMVVYRPERDEKWAYRRDAAERILEAVKAMVIERASGA
jgi:tetratricopeptide (TPR) repeat protein